MIEWFRLALRFDPKSRGREVIFLDKRTMMASEELVVFDKLDKVLSKKVHQN